MKKLLLLLLVFLFTSTVHGATLIWEEDFDDGTLDDPVGAAYIDVKYGIFNTPTLGVHYEISTPGYGGTGYSFKAKNPGSAGHDTSMRYYEEGTWDSNELTVEYDFKFANFNVTPYPSFNCKFYYPRWGSNYVSLSPWNYYYGSGSPWGWALTASDKNGNSLTGSQQNRTLIDTNPTLATEPTDGNWHNIKIYTNTSACLLKIWYDGALIYDFGPGDLNFYSGCWSQPAGKMATFGYEDAGTQDYFNWEIDNIKVWEGLPGSNSAPSVSISSPSCPSSTDSATQTFTGTASDTDGTISTVTWSNDFTSGSGSCTADDGTFNSASEAYTCSSIPLGTGENSITITTTDNESSSGIENCVVTYPIGADTTAPAVTIDTPTTAAYYNNSTNSVTVSGTFVEDGGDATGAWACSTCPTTSGTVTVNNTLKTFTVTITLPTTGYGSDVIVNGSFASGSTSWTYDDNWSFDNIDATSSRSAGASKYLTQENTSFSDYSRVTLCYDITEYTSGDLYLSQFSYIGTGNGYKIIDAADSDTYSIGNHCYTDLVQSDTAGLQLGDLDFNGSIDNVTLRQYGGSNTVTITLTDENSNEGADSIVVNYFTPGQTSQVSGAINLRIN